MNCRGYNAFGRRRRREISKNDKPDEDALDLAQRGQLREEITIESNAILTFERREERLMDPTEGKIQNILITLSIAHSSPPVYRTCLHHRNAGSGETLFKNLCSRECLIPVSTHSLLLTHSATRLLPPTLLLLARSCKNKSRRVRQPSPPP